MEVNIYRGNTMIYTTAQIYINLQCNGQQGLCGWMTGRYSLSVEAGGQFLTVVNFGLGISQLQNAIFTVNHINAFPFHINPHYLKNISHGGILLRCNLL